MSDYKGGCIYIALYLGLFVFKHSALFSLPSILSAHRDELPVGAFLFGEKRFLGIHKLNMKIFNISILHI